jgi:hypothetical protein
VKIHTIYLDLDDVCNTLTPHLLWWVNCPVEQTDYSTYPGKMEIVPAANRLLGSRRYTRATFWQSIPRRAWAAVPRTPELPWLLRACKRLVGENIFLATSPTKDPDCLAGKLEWIQANLPRWLHRQYFVTPRKWKLAQPGTLLIDDNETNCRLFEEHGGRVIRFPRPWNTAASHSPRRYLETYLSHYQEPR